MEGPESEAQLQRVFAVRSARTIPRLEMEIQVKKDGYLERRRERQKLESLLNESGRAGGDGDESAGVERSWMIWSRPAVAMSGFGSRRSKAKFVLIGK